MKILKYTLVSILVLSTPEVFSTINPTTPILAQCEDAIESNMLATVWLTKWKQRPTTSAKMIEAAESGLWCYARPDKDGASNHWEIIQYDSYGEQHYTGILINMKDDNWVKNNWGKTKRACTVPYDLVNGTNRILSFHNGTDACLVTYTGKLIGGVN